MENKWILIVNPASATAQTGQTWEKYEKQLIDGGLELDHVLTQNPGHATELARESAEKGYRKFIAMGGDGTIHQVMTGLLRYADSVNATLDDFTLAVIPAGTGNDWIRTAGVPASPEQAVECILKGNTAKEDIVRMKLPTGTFCMANIGGIGLDANICYNTNALKGKGYKGSFLYSLVAPYSIFSKKFRRVKVECDGEKVFEGRMNTIVFGNGVYRGGGLKQTLEGGKWDDSQVEISIQKGTNHIKTLMEMLHIYKGDFSVLPGIVSRRVHSMTVTPIGKGKADRVEIDGEIPGTLPLTLEVSGQQINIIVP